MTDAEISQDDVDKIAGALYAGRKIEAVKLYRTATGHDLKTALDFVNQVEARLRAESPEKFTAVPASISGPLVVLILLVILLLVAGACGYFIGAGGLANSAKPVSPPMQQTTSVPNASDPATTISMAPEQESPFAADLSGKWRMHLPANFEIPAEIIRVEDSHYRLKLNGIISGLYELRGKRLVMEKPNDEQQVNQWKFRWQIEDADHLLLIGQPDPRHYGGHYLGATLTRNSP
jgi:hypothetical protein